MPFFCKKALHARESYSERYFVQMRKKNKINKATLQVRIQKNRYRKNSRKRVSLSASASMTAEAALVLPLFLFACLILMMPFRILDVERQMQAIVNSVGEDISQAAYLTVYLPGGDGSEGGGSDSRRDTGGGGADGSSENGEEMEAEDDSGRNREIQELGEVLSGGFGSGFINTAAAYGYAETMIRMRADELPVRGLSLLNSSLLEDGETIDLYVSYQIELPFSVLGLAAVRRTNRCFLRAWIGKAPDGASEEEDQEDEDDPIVYVGRNGTRYHLSASCHYLSNHLTEVSLSRIEEYRNTGGSRYTPCAVCGGRDAPRVYIMPSGEHYHTDASCSAISAYVRAVRRSEVESLGVCSYCSRYITD